MSIEVESKRTVLEKSVFLDLKNLLLKYMYKESTFICGNTRRRVSGIRRYRYFSEGLNRFGSDHNEMLDVQQFFVS